MSEQDNTKQVEDQDINLTADDLFAPSLYEQADAEAPLEDNIKQEDEAEQVESDETEEVSEEKGGSEEDVKFKALEKRLEDSRKWGNDNNQKLVSVLKKLEDGNLVDSETLDALRETADIKVEEEGVNPFQAIGEQIAHEVKVVSPLLAKEGEKPEEYLKAFSELAVADPALQQELLETPADERTRFVLEKGKDLHSTWEFVKGKTSMLQAVTDALSQKDTDIESMKKDLRAEILKEIEEGTENTPTATGNKRPKLKGSSTSEAKDEGILTANDLFGR